MKGWELLGPNDEDSSRTREARDSECESPIELHELPLGGPCARSDMNDMTHHPLIEDPRSQRQRNSKQLIDERISIPVLTSVPESRCSSAICGATSMRSSRIDEAKDLMSSEQS